MRALVAAWAGVFLALSPGPASAAEPVAAERAAAPAKRIVSLNPSLTAILLAIGAREQLVGVDDYSARQRPELAELPRVGGLYNPSLEAVVALRPDLVVLVPSAEQRGFRDRLASLGVPRLAVDPQGFDAVVETIELLGERVGHSAAARERAEAIRATRRQVEDAVAGLPRVRTVLVLQRDPLFLVGRGSFIDEMLASAGARNLGAELEGSYPRVAREWLLSAAPDLLIDSARAPEPATDFWRRWPSLPAVANERIVSFPEGLVTLPGPQLDEALRALVGAVHPGALEASAP